jgi:hypothetical protein
LWRSPSVIAHQCAWASEPGEMRWHIPLQLGNQLCGGPAKAATMDSSELGLKKSIELFGRENGRGLATRRVCITLPAPVTVSMSRNIPASHMHLTGTEWFLKKADTYLAGEGKAVVRGSERVIASCHRPYTIVHTHTHMHTSRSLYI